MSAGHHLEGGLGDSEEAKEEEEEDDGTSVRGILRRDWPGELASQEVLFLHL